MPQNLPAKGHTRQLRRRVPSARAMRAGVVTIDELCNACVWLARSSPEQLQEIIRLREQFCRDLLAALKGRPIEMPRLGQRERILRLLTEANGAWVSLPEILRLGVAQYSARICELRQRGHRIENKTEHVNGVIHSWFRLPPSLGQLPLLTLDARKDERAP